MGNVACCSQPEEIIGDDNLLCEVPDKRIIISSAENYFEDTLSFSGEETNIKNKNSLRKRKKILEETNLKKQEKHNEELKSEDGREKILKIKKENKENIQNNNNNIDKNLKIENINNMIIPKEKKIIQENLNFNKNQKINSNIIDNSNYIQNCPQYNNNIIPINGTTETYYYVNPPIINPPIIQNIGIVENSNNVPYFYQNNNEQPNNNNILCNQKTQPLTQMINIQPMNVPNINKTNL